MVYHYSDISLLPFEIQPKLYQIFIFIVIPAKLVPSSGRGAGIQFSKLLISV